MGTFLLFFFFGGIPFSACSASFFCRATDRAYLRPDKRIVHVSNWEVHFGRGRSRRRTASVAQALRTAWAFSPLGTLTRTTTLARFDPGFEERPLWSRTILLRFLRVCRVLATVSCAGRLSVHRHIIESVVFRCQVLLTRLLRIGEGCRRGVVQRIRIGGDRPVKGRWGLGEIGRCRGERRRKVPITLGLWRVVGTHRLGRIGRRVKRGGRSSVRSEVRETVRRGGVRVLPRTAILRGMRMSGTAGVGVL